MPAIQRKLAAILAADIYQFSKQMGEDETGTLANLRACRQIVDAIIAEHHGRIFGTAGDSVVAEFASAVSAVLCAVECQRAIAQRNAQSDVRPLLFRIGINIGDVIVEGDNLYGDGVNVAARLEAIAAPGSICVSAKVYEEVRRKMADISFIDGGAQNLKNIEDPVAIYHVGGPGDAPRSVPSAPAAPPASEKKVVAVLPIRLISGDDEAKAFAEGLTDAISDALGQQTALTVRFGETSGADFTFKGSVQAAGKRLRLSFVLDDTSSSAQVWSQRYDRQLDDVFGLQDEIVLHVAAAIRIRVKAQIFERLRNSDNATLAVPQLLDKTAGYFVRWLDGSGEAVSTARLAIERAPEHSMARAMLGYALFRFADYSATAVPEATCDEIMFTLDRAIVLDSRSYVARAVKAMALHDFYADSRAAHDQAREALKANTNFVPAKGMLGVTELHLGNKDEGMRILRETLDVGSDDANYHRHCREYALGQMLIGDIDEAVRTATKLHEEKPDMKRNVLVLAGLLVAAGKTDAARRYIAELKAATPGLSLSTARLPRFGDAAAGQRFHNLLMDSGL
ncbi:MAG: adenylate/guanylate cyclase domain-containing protein [Reyranella sp.]